MLDLVRPKLLPETEVRHRSDGNEGLYHPPTGHKFETSREQANLVELFDGKRSLLEVSAEYMNRYGFVPFAAIDDLMHGLADAELLVDPPVNPELVERSSFERFAPHASRRFRMPWPAALRVLELLAFPALAVWVVLHYPRQAMAPIDVPLFYLGLVLALTLRGRFKAAICALFGAAPRMSQLMSAGIGVYFFAPDDGVAVLLNRGARVLAYLGALAGIATAAAIGWPWPGVFAGALVVALFDLCPLIASSASGVIGALTGRVNVRDQVRSFVGLPMLKNVLTLRFARGDLVLFFSAVLATAWVGAFFFVVLGVGIPLGLELLRIGSQDHTSWGMALAYFGAFVLLAICPLPLLLFVIINGINSAFELFWPMETKAKLAAGAVDLASFRTIPLFSKLAEADLAMIAAQSREVTYHVGQVIVQEGASGNTFYSLRRGSVEVTRGEAASQHKVVARLSAGDCFGETAMLKDGKRTATVRALSEAVVIELASEAFEKVVATVGGVDFASVLRAANTIGKSKLFKELPPERLSSLAAQFEPRSVPAGTDVVRFGEEGSEFYLLAKGEVDVLSADGKKLAGLKDGDHFGEIALLKRVPRTATVRTTTDSLLLVLSREVFLRALQADLSLSTRATEIADGRAGTAKS
ncbi:MAG: cyclic nucleotide-binding domain-containing protein [Myxococcaceae bacterium]